MLLAGAPCVADGAVGLTGPPPELDPLQWVPSGSFLAVTGLENPMIKLDTQLWFHAIVKTHIFYKVVKV